MHRIEKGVEEKLKHWKNERRIKFVAENEKEHSNPVIS